MEVNNEKKIYEVTAEEFIAINTVNGFIHHRNALTAVEIARLEGEPLEKRKLILVYGLTKKSFERADTVTSSVVKRP